MFPSFMHHKVSTKQIKACICLVWLRPTYKGNYLHFTKMEAKKIKSFSFSEKLQEFDQGEF